MPLITAGETARIEADLRAEVTLAGGYLANGMHQAGGADVFVHETFYAAVQGVQSLRLYRGAGEDQGMHAGRALLQFGGGL